MQKQNFMIDEQYLCLEENKIICVSIHGYFPFGINQTYSLTYWEDDIFKCIYRTATDLQRYFTLKTRLWELLYEQ